MMEATATVGMYDAILGEKLRRQAKALVDSVVDDEAGHLVAGQWVGGHGGLLSRNTIALADQVKATLEKMERSA
jgi:hypothetical protein